MQRELELTPAALADLRSIRTYMSERRGEAQEEAYLDRMWEKFAELIADSSPYRFRPDLFPGCQIAAEGKHVILFCVSQSTLQIVRVLHGAMDLKRHLPGA
jgi:toxin ParE1/3/4